MRPDPLGLRRPGHADPVPQTPCRTSPERGWNRAFWASFALLGLFYLGILFRLPPGGVWINDNGCRLIQMRAIAQSHWTRLDLPWPGEKYDPHLTCFPIPTPFAFFREGRVHATFSLPYAVVGSFIEPWGGVRGVSGLSALCGWLLCGAVGLIAHRASPERSKGPAAVLATILTGLSSPILFYSFTVWEYTPATLLLLAGFLLLGRGEIRQPVWAVIVAGLLTALAVWLRDDFLLGVGAFLLTALGMGVLRLRRAAVFCLAFAAGMAPLALWLWHSQGSPFGLHVGVSQALVDPFAPPAPETSAGLFAPLLRWIAERGRVFHSLVMKISPVEAITGRVVTLAGYFLLAGGLIFLSGRRSDRARWPLAILLWGWLLVYGIKLLQLLREPQIINFLYYGDGLLFCSAFMVLAACRADGADGDPLGADRTAERRRLWVAWSVAVFAAAYILVCPEIHTRGLHWGGRYLLPAYPLAIAAAAPIIVGVLRRGGVGAHRIPLLLLILVATMGEFVGLRMLESRKRFNGEVNRLVRAVPVDAVVTDAGFLAQHLHEVYLEKPIFLAYVPEQLPAILERLRQSGLNSVLLITMPNTPAGKPDRIIQEPLGLYELYLKHVPLK